MIVGLTMTKDCCCSNNIHKYVFVLFIDALSFICEEVVYHKRAYHKNFVILCLDGR